MATYLEIAAHSAYDSKYYKYLIVTLVFPTSFLSHLLIAGCDIGVQISVRPYVRSFVRSSTCTSKFSFLDIRDSCESETLHSNCP